VPIGPSATEDVRSTPNTVHEAGPPDVDYAQPGDGPGRRR